MTKRLTPAEKQRRCAARSISGAFDCLRNATYSEMRVYEGHPEQEIADGWYEMALLYMMYAIVQDPAYYDQFLFPWEQ